MKNIYLGDRGVPVEYLQLALSRAGYDIAVDGAFGRETCNALRAFLGTDTGCYVDNAVWERVIPYLKGYQRYTIRRGDTLSEIAERFQSEVSLIETANPGIDALKLELGTVLYIPYRFPLVSETVAYSSELNSYIIEGLAVRYPFMVSGSIGESVMGKRIPYLQLGVGDTQVFYNASFHANEWITTPVLLRFAEEYGQAMAADGDLYGVSASMLYQTYTLYLVPMVNPDGVDLVNGVLGNQGYYQQAAEIAADYPDIPFPSGWKANIEGVDLNLQFPAGWENAREIKYEQGYVSPAPRDYVGIAPLTAIESVNVYQFTRTHNFKLILAYHTQGEVIYWKYLDYEPEQSREIAQYFSEVSGYAIEETPYASGYAGYKDWFIMEYNRPGYTIEAGAGQNPLPMSQFRGIYEDNKGILLGGMTRL